jgi:transcriptional regulator with XRE-family HTH domain
MMNDISRKIHLLRILHNYTQVYVAGKLDISPSAYISIEQDATNITVKRLNSILEIYNISLLDFFSFTEDDVMNVLRKGKSK